VNKVGFTCLNEITMAYSQKEIDNIFNYVCVEIEKGRALRNILKDENMPSTSTFYQWLDSNTDKAKQYARATEIRADIIFDDILSIADENTNDTFVNDNGLEVVNNDVIQRSRLRIDARKWVLSKLNPKKYGDKIQQEHSGEVTTNVISLGSGIKPNETTS
jgi:hypothetical protein